MQALRRRAPRWHRRRQAMKWRESWRADPAGRRIADEHYNRQSVGADQFVPPGRCVVLVIPDEALWITSWPFGEFVKHAWPGAWVCSAFRNQRPDLHLSSSLITEAIAATRFYWEPPPRRHDHLRGCLENAAKTRSRALFPPRWVRLRRRNEGRADRAAPSRWRDAACEPADRRAIQPVRPVRSESSSRRLFPLASGGTKY